MDTESKVYRDLQKHLDRMPSGFTAVESGLDIKLLKHLFTPEEARAAVQLSMKPEPIERIYKRVRKSGMNVSIEELQKILDEMLRKGTLVPSEEGYGEKHYSSAEFAAGGIYSVQVDRLTKDLINDNRQYHEETSGMAKPSAKRILPLRTIPVEESIPLPEKYRVSDYDSVRKLIENAPGPLSVANCICRQTTEILGGHCTKTDLMEVCLMIGPDHARHYVDMGIGRYITKEEALDILEKVQNAGLIIQPENSLKPEAICCCCSDCCALLKPLLNHPRPVELFVTNYYVEFNAELCNGCGECIDKCQLDAREMVDGIATLNTDRCIGCGNCVVICSTDANKLIKKEDETILPKDKEDFNMQTLANRTGKWNTLKVRAKMLMGMKA